MRKLEEFSWWPELVALKDVLSLRELAERFEVTPGAISMALKRNNIGRESAPPGPRDRRRKKTITSDVAEVLSKDEDIKESLDKRFVVEPTVEPVLEEPVVEVPPPSAELPPEDALSAFEDMLGEVPDEEIANLAGVSVKEVAQRREKKLPAALLDGRKTSKLSAFMDILGKVPDRVVAEKANLSVSAVCVYRRRRGIPAYVPPKEEEVQTEMAFDLVPAPEESARPVLPPEPEPVEVPAPVVVAAPPAPVAAPAPPPVAPAPVVEEPPAQPPAVVIRTERKVIEGEKVRGYGYMVTIADKQYIVVGRDLLAAAEIALAANLGVVERIDLIGPAL